MSSELKGTPAVDSTTAFQPNLLTGKVLFCAGRSVRDMTEAIVIFFHFIAQLQTSTSLCRHDTVCRPSNNSQFLRPFAIHSPAFMISAAFSATPYKELCRWAESSIGRMLASTMRKLRVSYMRNFPSTTPPQSRRIIAAVPTG